MDQIQVPFEAFNIDPDDGQRVVAAVVAFLDRYPARSIPSSEISLTAGVPEPTAKLVLFALLALRHVKAAFRARCRKCRRIVGQPEPTVYDVKAMALTGQYWCYGCANSNPDDIEIELLFVKPGTEVVALELGA